MPAFTVQVHINLSEEGHGINAANIEDTVLAAIWSNRTMRLHLVSANAKLIVGATTRAPTVPDNVDQTINSVVRAWRAGTFQQMEEALLHFYQLCKTEPSPPTPTVVRLETLSSPEVIEQSKVRTRLYHAVFPLMNKRFKEPHTVPSRFFNTWTSPVSVFLDPTADVADSTATCEDVWEFVRAAIAQEFLIDITESHPLYRYTPGWTLATIAKLLTD